MVLPVTYKKNGESVKLPGSMLSRSTFGKSVLEVP